MKDLSLRLGLTVPASPQQAPLGQVQRGRRAPVQALRPGAPAGTARRARRVDPPTRRLSPRLDKLAALGDELKKQGVSPTFDELPPLATQASRALPLASSPTSSPPPALPVRTPAHSPQSIFRTRILQRDLRLSSTSTTLTCSNARIPLSPAPRAHHSPTKNYIFPPCGRG